MKRLSLPLAKTVVFPANEAKAKFRSQGNKPRGVKKI